MNNERGLTLIELLATIVIFSMIAGVTYSMVSYVQGSWTHTKGVTQTESKVQELQTVLTRELSSPKNLTYNNTQINYQDHEDNNYKLTLNGNQLSLYINGILENSFSLPVQKITVLDKNKSVIPTGTTLNENYAILRVFYTKQGLSNKSTYIDYTMNLYDPKVQ